MFAHCSTCYFLQFHRGAASTKVHAMTSQREAERPITLMQNRKRLSSSLAMLRAAKHRDQLEPALRDLCLRYGLSHMTFLVAHIRGQSARYPYFCTTYPAAWTEAYFERNYFDVDPVIGVLRWGHLPVDWSSLDWRPTPADHFFKEATRHGVGPHGLTVPVRGPKGERCLFSVTSNCPKRDWSSVRASSIHELHILSHYLHETVLAVTGLRDAGGYRELSARERQCLQLLATGRISKQIAAALGISESAVKLYLRSARTKLDASTSHQAVAKASFLELIDL
jgi:DNA-binding CsgD family transcriptional regulator